MGILDTIRNGLVVSCQALEEEPLHGPMLMATMARAAYLGGAVGIRTNGRHEIEVIKKMTDLPIIGIQKVTNEADEMSITPTFSLARQLVEAGADMVAVDVRKERPFGEPLEVLLPRIRKELSVPVMADCATLVDAQAAVKIGVDAVASTFGFRQNELGVEPDFDLLEKLLKFGVPVIAEGGFWYPEQVVKAFQMGAWSVVVGSAITRPLEITKRFVQALKGFDPR